MGRLLDSHIGPWLEHIPPHEMYRDSIDVSPTHWYWDKPFDDIPTFRHAGCTFVVARLLWNHQNPDAPLRRTSLRNTCGVAACVNPTHWEWLGRPCNWTLPPDASAQLFSAVAPFAIHILPPDSAYTMCAVRVVSVVSSNGMVKPAGSVAPAGAVITCKKCLKEWQSYGRPLLEVL